MRRWIEGLAQSLKHSRDSVSGGWDHCQADFDGNRVWVPRTEAALGCSVGLWGQAVESSKSPNT